MELRDKKQKYKVIYMPDSSRKHPTFDSNDEAWKYIENLSKKCNLTNDGKICESCMAEYWVDKI